MPFGSRATQSYHFSKFWKTRNSTQLLSAHHRLGKEADCLKTAELMRYFKTSDPDDLSQGALSDRVHFLKCEEEGIKLMCKVTEEIYEIGREEGREEGLRLGKTEEARKAARNMAERGFGAEMIAEIIEESAETVRQWLDKKAEQNTSALLPLR